MGSAIIFAIPFGTYGKGQVIMANIAYLRVSTADQSLDRQRDALVKLGIYFEPRFIFEEKMSGASFNRPVYQAMKQVIRKGDVLFIKALNRLGRNKAEMMKEWEDIYKIIGADISVIDVPLLDTRNNKDRTSSLIGDLVLVVLSHLAEDELIEKKQLQREGIEAAKKRGKHLGRPRRNISDKDFLDTLKQVKEGMMTASIAMKKMGISKSTYYRHLRASNK